MRGFERTAVKQRLYESVLREARYPIQPCGVPETPRSSSLFRARMSAGRPG